MKSSYQQFKRVGLACVALGAIAVSQQSLAAGTASGTVISNQATVNYQVSGVAQTAIQSSPTGSGPALATTFVVDNKVNLTVTRVDGAAVSVTPGGTNFVTTFKLTNTGNTSQGYQLAATNLATSSANPFGGTADGFDMSNVRRFVSTAACGGANPTPSYSAATDTATFVNTLAADACVYVFIVSDAPGTATNAQVAVVNLAATTAVAGTNAATLVTETAGADTAGSVDVVFADTGRNAIEAADDAYVVSSAALAVAKTSTVISDPFNGSTNPKAIPGAVIEYGITLTNTGGSNATVVTVTDALPSTGITYTTGTYNSGASDVRITVGATNTFCVAEAGSDTNGDGCFRTAGGVLTVGAPALTQVATGGAANAVTVRFRMTITP